jgi:hypothetical protein
MGVRRRECEHGVRDAHETRESEPCLRCIDDTIVPCAAAHPHRAQGTAQGRGPSTGTRLVSFVVFGGYILNLIGMGRNVLTASM